MTLAHAADAGGLPFSRGLMSYVLVAALGIALWALRARTVREVLARGGGDAPAGGSPATDGGSRPVVRLPVPLVGGWVLVVTRTVGFLGLAALIAVAQGGEAEGGLNPATLMVVSVAYLVLQPLCFLIGDLWAPFDPFAAVAGLADRLAGPARRAAAPAADPPTWAAAAGLLAFLVVTNAGPDNFPPPAVASGEATATVLVGLALWAAILGAVSGAEAARAALPFSRLAAILGRAGILTRRGDRRLAARPPLAGLDEETSGGPGAGALLWVWLGGVLYAALSLTDWWARVLSGRNTGVRQILAVVGLVWAVALVAAVHQTATWLVVRVGQRRSGGVFPVPAAELADGLAVTLVPLGVAWTVAHFVAGWLIDVQLFRVFVSDPLVSGRDLFGTIRDPVNYAPLTPAALGWIESAVLLAGAMASAVVGHRAAVRLLPIRQALGAGVPLALELGAGLVTAMYVLVG
jgi:hypothetical protein